MWHPNSSKHKANHRGYNSKPTKKAVKALLYLYEGVSKLPESIKPVMKNQGTQLSLF